MSSTARTILVAMDNNRHSEHAFEWYMDHMHKQNDYILLVYITNHGPLVTTPIPLADPSIGCRFATEEDEIDEHLEKLKEKLNRLHVNGTVLRVSGITRGEAIMKISLEKQADMIITGKHHHGVIRRTFMGCVTQYLIDHSRIPVLIIRE